MASPAQEHAQRGPGSAPVAVAALRLPTLRQAPAAVREAGSGWGMIIVAGRVALVRRRHRREWVGKANCR
jgi:hypothetical protein